MEEQKRNYKNDVWESKKTTKTDGKLISYWCFSPGFGYNLLDEKKYIVLLNVNFITNSILQYGANGRAGNTFGSAHKRHIVSVSTVHIGTRYTNRGPVGKSAYNNKGTSMCWHS